MGIPRLAVWTFCPRFFPFIGYTPPCVALTFTEASPPQFHRFPLLPFALPRLLCLVSRPSSLFSGLSSLVPRPSSLLHRPSAVDQMEPAKSHQRIRPSSRLSYLTSTDHNALRSSIPYIPSLTPSPFYSSSLSSAISFSLTTQAATPPKSAIPSPVYPLRLARSSSCKQPPARASLYCFIYHDMKLQTLLLGIFEIFLRRD